MGCFYRTSYFKAFRRTFYASHFPFFILYIQHSIRSFMKKTDATKLFLIWGTLCLLANILCTNASAFGGDQGYWADWIQKLANGGIENFNGNYPPLYVFWLWVVSKVYVLANIPIDKTFMLKFLCLWPIYFAHLGLVDFTSRLAARTKLAPHKIHLILALVAFNPAFLLDGPMWGQVDLFPCIFGVAALYCINFKRKIKYAAMFFALALLAKFQMILLLPIFGGLFLRQYRISWKGLPCMAIAIGLVFLPFIVGGNLGGMLSNAYINTTSQYPFSTYNAANLWMFLAGNLSSDATPLFDLPNSGIWFLLSPSWLGKILFVIVSAYILKCALFCKSLRRTFELATWEAFAFFLLLPGMHERYLLYAIPFALVWLVLDTKKAWFWATAITVLCSMNINIINSFKGADLWPWVSGLAVIVFVAGIVHNFAPRFFPFVASSFEKLKLPRFVPYVILSVFLVVELACEIKEAMPVDIELKDNQMYLTNLPIDHYTQEYGSPRINRTVEGKTLTVKGRQYEKGIGSHAKSMLYFNLPENAESLDFFAAVDDEVSGGGSVKFRVSSEGKVLWSSGVVQGNHTPVQGKVDVSGLRTICLEIDSNGDNAYDHADWLNLILTLKK